MIDDLIDSHPSLIDSYPNEAYRSSRALCLLDLIATKKQKHTELALPINRGGTVGKHKRNLNRF